MIELVKKKKALWMWHQEVQFYSQKQINTKNIRTVSEKN